MERRGQTGEPMGGEGALEHIPKRSRGLVREVRALRQRANEARERSRALVRDLSEARLAVERQATLISGGSDD